MNELALIYLLSISAKISFKLHVIGVLLCILSILVYILAWMPSVMAHGAVATKEAREIMTTREPVVRKHVLRGGGFGICLLFLSALLPDTRAVIEAYAIVEGSKVINADNAEAAGEAVGKRFDRFLDIIQSSVAPDLVEKAEEVKDQAKDLKEKLTK